MKTYRLKSVVLGTALALTATGISRAGPSPDLMNSIHWLRMEAQKRAIADAATPKQAFPCTTYWSWSRTRSITAGQSTVSFPDLSQRVVTEAKPGDFKLAPLQQRDSKPEIK